MIKEKFNSDIMCKKFSNIFLMPKLSQKHRKMLIIGGSGFIGYHLAKLVLKKGWNIDSISRKFPKKIENYQKLNI